MHSVVKYYIGILFFLCCICNQAHGQYGLNLIKRIDYDSLHGFGLAGCWGYTDEFGNEYALVGANIGISIFDITNPTTPVEKLFSPANWCNWREIQTYNNYAYITSECANMRIIDLSPLPAFLDSSHVTVFPGDTTVEYVANGHSLFISNDGILFYNGANGGVILYDLNVNPTNPPQIGKYDLWWVHDSYERNDTLYCANIDKGFFSILGVSDPSSIQFLGSETTTKGHPHNIALNSEGNVLFITDEIYTAPISVYDISDFGNIQKLCEFKHQDSCIAIPHNVYQKNNLLYTAYYTEGITVHDITDPRFPIEVAHYDTYPLNNSSAMDGCWGVYPYFPSGRIISSDQQNGLYIFNPTFTNAYFVQGIITDSMTFNTISDVSVRMLENSTTLFSDINGYYQHGNYLSDTFHLEFSKTGYITDTITVVLSPSGTTIRNVKLKPIPYISYLITLKNSQTLLPIENAIVSLKNNIFEYSGLTDVNGNFYIPQLFLINGAMAYDFACGKWGFKNFCDDSLILDTSVSSNTYYLSPEYYDDFYFDYGWQTIDNTASFGGGWVREVPYNSAWSNIPIVDYENDCGETAYLTGNLNSSATVYTGFTTLYSPFMDLTSYSDPYLKFKFWYRSTSGNDTCHLTLENDSSIILDAFNKYGGPNDSTWQHYEYRLKDFTSSLNNIRIIFNAVNYSPNGPFDVALDQFYIQEMDSTIGINEFNQSNKLIMVHPNPTNGTVTIQSVKLINEIMVTDLAGKVLLTKQVNSTSTLIDLHEFTNGIYLLQTIGTDGTKTCTKIIRN